MSNYKKKNMETNKTFLSIIILLSISLSSLLFLRKESKTKIQNYLLLNVEALAQNESGNNIICLGIGSLDCPNIGSKVKHIYIY